MSPHVPRSPRCSVPNAWDLPLAAQGIDGWSIDTALAVRTAQVRLAQWYARCDELTAGRMVWTRWLIETGRLTEFPSNGTTDRALWRSISQPQGVSGQPQQGLLPQPRQPADDATLLDELARIGRKLEDWCDFVCARLTPEIARQLLPKALAYSPAAAKGAVVLAAASVFGSRCATWGDSWNSNFSVQSGYVQALLRASRAASVFSSCCPTSGNPWKSYLCVRHLLKVFPFGDALSVLFQALHSRWKTVRIAVERERAIWERASSTAGAG